MGTVDSKGVAKVTEVDLAASQETVAIPYKDGDDDESAVMLEDEPAMAALLVATPGLWIVEAGDVTVTITWAHYLKEDGLPDGGLRQDFKEMLEHSISLEKYAAMIDSSVNGFASIEKQECPGN